MEVVSSLEAVLGCVLAQKTNNVVKGNTKRSEVQRSWSAFYSDNLGAFGMLLKKVQKLVYILYVPIPPG